MPFVLVLPFIVIGIVIATVKKAAEQNQRAEAQRRAAQMQREQDASEGQASYTPIRPTVQAPPVRRSEPVPRTTVQKAYQSPLAQQSQAHPKHDDCSLRPDAKAQQAPPWKHPQHEDCSLDSETASKPEPYSVGNRVPALQGEGTTLDFTPDNIVRGVLFSEIFGKPKALR